MTLAKTATIVTVSLIVGLVAGVFLGPIVIPPPKQEVTSVKFILDWAIQGYHAPFIVALEKGYFAQEGLAVVMDRGYGSADSYAKIAAGTYQMGYGSLDVLIEFNSKNPGNELIAVYIVMNSPPYSVITLKNKGITSPKDLEGKKIGGGAADSSRRLFPVFAKATGIDMSKIEWVTVTPALREPSLVKGEVSAITAYYISGYINLLALNVEPNDIIAFKYSDYVKLYGDAIVVRKDFMMSNPEAVAKFIRAVNRALKEVIADPDKAADYVKQRDPLVDRNVELQRLKLALKDNILTEEVRRNGLGSVDKARLEETIKMVAEAFNLPKTPTVEEVFTDRFLPALEDRKL
jgi:NitT/TauT family transport system substrate-binding protein